MVGTFSVGLKISTTGMLPENDYADDYELKHLEGRISTRTLFCRVDRTGERRGAIKEILNLMILRVSVGLSLRMGRQWFSRYRGCLLVLDAGNAKPHLA